MCPQHYNNSVIFKLLQWNCCGYYPRLERLQVILTSHHPDFIYLQETKFPNTHSPHLKGFNTYNRNYTTHTIASGGAFIFVKNTILTEPLDLNTDLEAIAIQAWTPNKLTICNIYIPPDKIIIESDLSDLVAQLPTPYTLVGDFNAHSELWGSHSTNARGKVIEDLLTSSNLALLNNRQSTHFHVFTGNFSCIDLSLCDSSSFAKYCWNTLKDLHDSDHFPIEISTIGVSPQRLAKVPKNGKLTKQTGQISGIILKQNCSHL